MSDRAQQSDLSLEIPATIYGGRVPAFRESLSQDFVSIAGYPVTMHSSQKSHILYHLWTSLCTVSFVWNTLVLRKSQESEANPQKKTLALIKLAYFGYLGGTNTKEVQQRPAVPPEEARTAESN